MFGIILVSLGTLFEEIGDLIGKAQARKGRQDLYAMGFFTYFWPAIIFLVIIFFRAKFIFSLQSLPTFAIRSFLEILQAHFTVKAIMRADRSTFGFIRVLTLPLLLVVDFFLGYAVTARQVGGIVLIVMVLVFIFLSDKIGGRGRWLTLFTSLNAVATTSLFKYNITHFNSVEAEQFLVIMILLVYFWASGRYWTGQNNLRLLFSNRVFLWQSLSQGFANLLESFAIKFAPASVILAGKRSTATIWTALSGRFVFSEKNFAFKLVVLTLLVSGILLLAL